MYSQMGLEQARARRRSFTCVCSTSKNLNDYLQSILPVQFEDCWWNQVLDFDSLYHCQTSPSHVCLLSGCSVSPCGCQNQKILLFAELICVNTKLFTLDTGFPSFINVKVLKHNMT